MNINTAPLEVLQALDSRIDGSTADRIIRGRPWDSVSKVKDIVGAETLGRISPRIDIKSSLFSVEGEGKVGDVVRRLHALLKRQPPKVSLLLFRIE